MKAVLLAAGRSQRMQPVPDKNFLMFLGKPLVVHQIEQLINAGFRDIIVVGGAHNLNSLKALPKSFDFKKAKIAFVEQKNLDDGMAGAIMSLKNIIKNNEPVIFVSSNDVVDAKAFGLMKKACSDKKNDSCILAKKLTKYFPGGYLKTNKQGYIQKIVEKPGEGKEPSDLVNIVIHCHKNPKKLIEVLEKTKTTKDDRYEMALDKLIKAGYKLKAVEYDGFCQPVKYPWHVFKVMNFFLKNIKKKISWKAKISKRAVVNGPVIIEDGVKIYDNAVINGPAYIGKNTIIATSALVRDSMINENCVIGFATEIARSYLGNAVWTHTNYIGDSIISDNCSFGSGTVTGNLRLDEGNITVNIRGEKINSGMNKFGLITGENIRAGINTSFMPGIKIGSNSMIGAGIIIPYDIPENSFVKGKVDLEIKPNKAKVSNGSREEMMKKLK